MYNPQNEVDKNEQILKFLVNQVDQKVKQDANATKLLYHSMVVLAAGIAITLTALGALQDLQKILTVLTFATPVFLIGWFGCYLFLYWEHHMLRVSLDYYEKMAAELNGVTPSEIYLYHEDFLGVFNQTDFLPKLAPFIKFKSVHAVFFIIGLPVAIVFGASLYMAKTYITDVYIYICYLLFTITSVLVLLGIHFQSLRKERELKDKLGITPWQKRQEKK